MRNLLCIGVLAGLIATVPAWAHGSAAHATKRPVTQPQMEQKDWGIAGDARAVRRTLHITMSDRMRFTPDRIRVQTGETVRLVFRNEGRQLHEFVLGTRQELEAHAALMLKFPDMEHDEPYMAHVPPGRTAQIVWTFNRPGVFDFGCLIPGHFQAGMVGQVQVGPAPKDPPATAAAAPESAADGPVAAAADGLSEDEIRKLYPGERKLLIRHGDMPQLGMGPMTMVFAVKTASLLKGLKAGDKVRFTAERQGEAYVVTAIQAAP